jgi:DNA-binding MarR family transcriptional regulator
MDGMTSRGETSGHTRRLRGGDLGMLMRTGYHRTMEYVQARLEQLGFDDVRPAHMAIFQNLGPEGARIGELAERAKLTNQSVGYLVDYLEEHGYVERRPDPANRRATLVCFTERGWDEADACAKILDQLDEELTKRMGADRLEQLHALLAEATAALQASKLTIAAPRGDPGPGIQRADPGGCPGVRPSRGSPWCGLLRAMRHLSGAAHRLDRRRP